MNYLVSIVMPVHNSGKYIEESILSVLSQSYSNWELIIVDDCSTDNSLLIIQKYLDDPRIKLFKNIKNIGPALTRNVALNNVNGEYISFLDSDDFWSDNKLEKQITFMVNNQLSITHGNYYFCSSSGKVIKSVVTDEKIDYRILLKGNQFKTMTMMLSSHLIANKRFENIKHEDYAFFLDCLKQVSFSVRYTADVDSFCRIGKVSVSSNKLKSAIWTFNIYRKHQKLGIIESIYYFINYAINGFRKYRGKR